MAAAQPAAPGPRLAPEPPARGSYESPAERDPFAVPLEEKLAVLAAAEAGLRTDPRVALTLARFQALRVDKLFASTEGALCEQRLTECGGGLAAVAVDGDESQIRSYPASHGGHVAQAGYEHFLALDLAGHAPRVAEEAVALLSAPACPAGRTTLILAGEQLGAPGARVDRPRGRARPRARPRGVLRRHELRARPTRSGRCASAPST